MENLLRREVVETAQTIVVKIGSNVLTRSDDSLDLDRIAALAEQIHRITLSGRKVVVVSSGAIATGLGLLGLRERPKELPYLQAAAATGQAHLIRLYDDALRRHGWHAAQILLTANDFKSRTRYLNVRNTLRALFEFKVIPIINENDTVSVAEIRFGDNDRLAALVTGLVPDPLLIILSIVNGLYTGDPSDPNSKPVPLVSEWTDQLQSMVSDTKSARGTGGMKSKLDAVRLATSVGDNVIIASGQVPGILDQILSGNEVGTLFLARGPQVPAFKRWIGYNLEPRGRLHVDPGACAALTEKGKSLLAIGVSRVDGDFIKGEVVAICDNTGREFARGLCNFDSRDTRLIAGKKTEQIASILGKVSYTEIVHRDNLVVLGR